MALGCLTDVSNELSVVSLKFDAQTIEGLGRKLFGTQNGIWADKLPSLPNDLGIPEDNYWAENTVQFPAAWAEKLTLPIGLLDLSSLPAKYRLLAGDEGVLAFWKFVEHCERLLKTAREQLHAEMQKATGATEGDASSQGGASPEDQGGELTSEQSTSLDQAFSPIAG